MPLMKALCIKALGGDGAILVYENGHLMYESGRTNFSGKKPPVSK
jgi:hypothetical protein